VVRQAVEQLAARSAVRRRLIDDDNVETTEAGLVAPERLSHNPLDTVPGGRPSAMLLRDREPEPCAACATFSIQHGKPFITAAFRFFEDAAVCGSSQ
jgi:hypothetical protein